MTDGIYTPLDDVETKLSLASLMAILPPREAFVIENRFGLNGEPPKTRKEVADIMANGRTGRAGISCTRVLQIEKKAIARLKRKDGISILFESLGVNQ